MKLSERLKHIFKNHFIAAQDTEVVGQQIRDCIKQAQILESQTRWIPVEEGLPEEDKSVLLWIKYGDTPLVGRYNKEHVDKFIPNTEHFEANGIYENPSVEGNFIGTEVTHWQPLPEPPKVNYEQ